MSSRLAWLAVLAVALGAGASTTAQEQGDYQVIVNSANPVKKLSADDVSNLFLKKKTTWKDGTPVEPVDLPADSDARRAFTLAIHGRSVASVKSYWQQQIFSGRSAPPPEKASEEDVILYVAEHRGAIGYVRASTGVGGPVKAVRVVR